MSPRRKYANDQERILRNVLMDANGCWVWIGNRTPANYGRVNAYGRVWKAHRLSYEAFIGPIPGGLTLDHLCRNRPCVNPRHLDPVPPGVNTLRSPYTVPSINSTKTECPDGHPYDEANTYFAPNGSRRCRACRNKATSAHYHAHRTEILARRRACRAQRAAGIRAS